MRNRARLPRASLLAAAVGVLALLLGGYNSVRNPLFEAPDEWEHFQYVRTLAATAELPVQELDGSRTQFHQPPLYYALAAGLTGWIGEDGYRPVPNPYWTSYRNGEPHRDNKAQFLRAGELAFPYEGTALVMHLGRLLSLLLFGGTLYLTWRMGRRLWPERPYAAVLMLALVGLNPMAIYVAGSLNNDNLVNLAGAAVLLLTLRALDDDFRWSTTLLIALAWGVALLAKLPGLFLAAVWGAGLLWVAWRRRSWRLLLTRGAVIGTLFGLLTGWWFLRNWQVYGEPLALERVITVWGARDPAQTTWPIISADLRYAWSNFWGRFGYGQIVLPAFFYLAYTLLTAGALLGAGVRLVRERGRSRWPGGAAPVLLVAVLVYAAALFYYIYRNPTGANGRYTFPALPAFAALLVWGWHGARWPRPAVAGGVALLAGLALYAVAYYVPWTYAPPAPVERAAVVERVGEDLPVTWPPGLRLLGVEVTPRELEGGEEAAATVCLETTRPLDRDYPFFVHLLDVDFNPLGQRNTHPGLGTYPTSLWPVERPFCEIIRVPVPEQNVTEREIARVEIGFYEPDGGPLPATVDGQEQNPLFVDTVKVVPAESAGVPPPPLPVDAAFTQDVTLAGYVLEPAAAAPGDPVTLRLWWESGGALDADYQIFVHLRDEDGNMIAQADGPPRGGSYPTSFWGAGETIIEERLLTLPENGSAGLTTVEVGFYRLANGVRLPRAGDAALPDRIALPGPEIVEGRRP